jgi:DNA-binding transcriptional LysR family regulator
MNIDMHKLEAFLKTIEYGSITAAAEYMNYTQPGISRMIREMEKEWGISLIERSRAGVHLTSTGEDLLPVIQQAYNGCENLKMQINNINGLKTGTIRIGSFTSGAISWLPAIMSKYQQEYPNIKFEVKIDSYTNIEHMIFNGLLDGAFLPVPPKENLDYILLDEDNFYAVLPKEHPLCKYDIIPLAELEKYPFLMIQYDEDSEVFDYFRQHGVHPNTRLTLWDDFVAMALVEKNIGISIMSSTILRRTPFDLEIRDLEVPLNRKIGLVLKDRKLCSVAMKSFINYLGYRNE